MNRPPKMILFLHYLGELPTQSKTSSSLESYLSRTAYILTHTWEHIPYPTTYCSGEPLVRAAGPPQKTRGPSRRPTTAFNFSLTGRLTQRHCCRKMPIEIVCAIVFGVVATVLAVATMIQNYAQWRNERRLVGIISLPHQAGI